MITNNFSFFGALGNAQNIAASNFLSIPNTIDVPHEYSIDTDVPSVAEFLTCSLNGRLWLFRRSRRFYVAVLKWHEDTQRLVFVSTIAFSNENIIRRGVNWILTDKSLVLSSDDEPFFSRIEYDADDTTFIDALNQSYSLFPELETWEEIQYGIVHIQNPPSDEYKEIKREVLIPFEFHYYSDDNILDFTDFIPQLYYFYGQLYGKGKAHIGKVYLFPYRFNGNGEPNNFCLYISPDYLRVYDTEKQDFDDNDGWDKLMIAPLNSTSIGIFTPQNDDTNDDTMECKKAENGLVFALPQNKQFDYSANNGTIFFDLFTHYNLVLNDLGASFLHDDIHYECNALRQWIAPTGIINNILLKTVISALNNSYLATYFERGFCREFISENILPIAINYSLNKNLSLGIADVNNKKNIRVHTTEGSPISKAVDWDNIYKQTAKIKMLNSFLFQGQISPVYCADKEDDADLSTLEQKYPTPIFIFEESKQYSPTYIAGFSQNFGTFANYKLDTQKTSGIESYNAKLRYVNPISGELSPEFNISFTFHNVVNTTTFTYYVIDGWTYNFGTAVETFRFGERENEERIIAHGTILYDFCNIYVYDGKIGILCQRREYLSVAHFTPFFPLDTDIEIKPGETYTFGANVPEKINSTFIFYPIMDVPEEIKTYIPDAKLTLEEQCGLFMNGQIDHLINNISYKGAVFLDYFFKQIYCSTGIEPGDPRGQAYYVFLNFPNSDSKINNLPVCKKTMHVMSWRSFPYSHYYLVVYISETYPDIFDFDSEIERSKLF